MGSAVTDSRGLFRLRVVGANNASDVIGSYLTINNTAGCKDSGTGLPLPILIGALVDVPSGTLGPGPVPVVVNGLTTLVYFTKKNINSPQISPYSPFFGGSGFTARQFYSQFASYIGISLGERAAYIDLINATLTGVPNGVDAQSFNVQVINSLMLGASLLTGISPSVTAAQAAEAFVVAVYPAAAGFLLGGKTFHLSSAESLSAVFNRAIGSAPQNVVGAGSTVLAAVNTYIANQAATVAPGYGLLNKFAQAVAASQGKLSSAAFQLGAKTLSPADALAAYTGAGLQRVLTSTSVPGLQSTRSMPLMPAPAPAPALSVLG